ncbi:MGDG synthase family glycosyltransferase [Actinoallomurus acaciae]|uniref:Diacylglycerol glucosyltransferase N-terminal domain-containing protein n=1 Tax=Actinoallomurus acaciae TaxID=502577 RepID=A0ABV5YZQ2_9ACTN
MSTRRVLILSAGMGAGHDRVAGELARRLATTGIDAEVTDILDLLPLRSGHGMRRWYGWTVHHTPWLYAGIYRIFFTSPRAPAISPFTALLAARLDDLVRRRAWSALVSTFHMAAQAAGHLRAHGRLPVPSLVMVTDFAVHRLWLHPGNDGHLCLTPAAVREIRVATGRPAWCHAPVVRPEFRRPRAAPSIGSGDRPRVLVNAGSWGVGRVEETTRVLSDSGRYLPVVLCGENRRLRRRLDRTGGCVALGWRDDVPELMAASYAVIDNASGLTCEEAVAAGVPVICYRPIPGHGLAGARAMARAGVGVHARDGAELLDALDRLRSPLERDRRVRRAGALFERRPVEDLLRCLLP